MIKDFRYSAYNKIITLNLQNLPQNIEETIKDEQKLLQFIQSRMNDKRVANKTILMLQPSVPKKIIICSKYILKFIGDQQLLRGKGKRTKSQTSNQINNEYTAPQSETLLPHNNIQSSVFYGCDFNLILSILSKSNASQKNKGDIGELVSLPFTYMIGPDKKFVRNYITTYQRVLDNNYDNRAIELRKSVDFILMYIQPLYITSRIKYLYKEFKKHEFYQTLMPYNDFVTDARFAINSNVPNVDNSIIVQEIGDKQILIITGQDKIGYNDEDIEKIILFAIINICETIEQNKRFKDCEIDLIYILAWSRKQEKGKQLVAPIVTHQTESICRKIMFNMITHFNGKVLKNIKSLRLSIFAENNLSDNVINKSSKMYKALSIQYPQYKQEFLNIYNTFRQLLVNNKFHRLCDTAEYEILLPSKDYLENQQSLQKLKEKIKKIQLRFLRNRILLGLNNYIKEYIDEPLLSEHSNISLIEEEEEEEDEYNLYFAD